ncbi:MAG: hypothetical protein GQ547_02605 [Methylophaga sp.]|nr:hypothetical protein [Methylophaga sp.]
MRIIIAVLFLSTSLQAEEVSIRQLENNIQLSRATMLESESLIKSSELAILQIEMQTPLQEGDGVTAMTDSELKKKIKRQKLILEEYNKIQQEQEVIRVESSLIQIEQEKIIRHFLARSDLLDIRRKAQLD